MATKDQRTQHASHSIDESAIERSNQVIRQLADVGIKVGGYSLGRKLGPAKPSTKGPKQGPLGIITQESKLTK